MLPLLNFFFAALLWVQVPQWSDDWSHCAVDVPDSSCHWYVANADNTFGEGFDWETAPWYSVEGLQDIADLHDKVLEEGNIYTVESLQKKLTPEEAEYLCNVLEQTSNYAIARGEQGRLFPQSVMTA